MLGTEIESNKNDVKSHFGYELRSMINRNYD